MLSLLFATSKELGYDDQIRRCRDLKGDICYVYKIRGVCYQTIRQIDERQSGRLGGRSTLVWGARQIVSIDDLTYVPNSAEVVIRDAWLQQGARTEKNIQDDIFASLQKVAGLLRNPERSGSPEPDDDRMIARINAASASDWEAALRCVKEEGWRDYFLRIDGEEFGAETRPKADDAAVSPDSFKETKQTTVKPAKLSSANRTSTSTSTSTSPSYSTPPAPLVQREYCIRKRHFLVYSEVCVALQSLTELKDVLSGLQHAVMGM